jgi:hypothetical protein
MEAEMILLLVARYDECATGATGEAEPSSKCRAI